MATLTETAYITRRSIKIGIIAIFLFIIGKIIFNLGTKIWRQLHPPPPPPPTVSFGKLPKIEFPSSSSDLNLSFKLETIEGGLPNLPTVAKVYFITPIRPNLLALERANQLAKKLGFRSQPQPINEKIYRWQGEKTATTLEIDINTLNFHLYYDYQNDPQIINEKNLPNQQQAAQEVKSFLANAELLPQDLASGTAEFRYFRWQPPNLVPALSLSEADFIQVNLFRADIEGVKVFPPNLDKPLIYFLFSGSRSPDKRIVEIKYIYYPIQTEIFGTYPLKPLSQAWTELQNKKGFIARLGENQDGQITIRKIYLGYYDSETPQNYLQPIYVFEGDRNFLAYVSAIDPQWTE
ncbi:MAG: hypothetical protein ACPLKP_02025 [Microgenomates group bacterium]